METTVLEHQQKNKKKKKKKRKKNIFPKLMETFSGKDLLGEFITSMPALQELYRKIFTFKVNKKEVKTEEDGQKTETSSWNLNKNQGCNAQRDNNG